MKTTTEEDAQNDKLVDNFVEIHELKDVRKDCHNFILEVNRPARLCNVSYKTNTGINFVKIICNEPNGCLMVDSK